MEKRNLVKQWKERQGKEKPSEQKQEQRDSKAASVRRGISTAKRNKRPLTQFALETLRDAEPQELTQEGRSPQTIADNERQITADQEVIGNPTHSTQPGTDSSATDNSNSISASGKIREHVTNYEEQIQAVEPQVRA